MKQLFFLMLACCTSILGFSQGSLSGVVTDEGNREPLPGVSIVVKGTVTGTTTDVEGRYSLRIPENASTLVFSFIGYETVEVDINNQSSIDVSLTQSVERLQEVVVVGYGTQKKVNLTGSVAVIDEKELAGRPITNATQALQGVKGLYVNQEGGQPGGDAATIRVRGIGTIGGSGKLDPLVLVDGIEYPLGDVNPSDIKSISVLKDAASTAIYGSRAANGVILITTKMGEQGQMSVNYSTYFGVQEVTYLPDPVTNSVVFMELFNQARINEGSPPLYAESLINEFRTNPTSLIYPNTDWMDVAFKRAAMQEHNLRFSGGSEQTRYNLSFRYLDQDGVLIGTSAKAYTANLGVRSQVSKRLSIEGSVIVSNRNLYEPSGGDRVVMNGVMRLIPMQPFGRMEDGNWPNSWVVTGQTTVPSPQIRAEETYQNLANNRLLGTASINYKILKNLSYQMKAAVNHRYSLTKHWVPELYLHDVRTGERSQRWSSTSTKTHTQNEDQSLTLFNTLSYVPEIGEQHSLMALAGSSFERFRQQSFSAKVSGFSSTDLQELSLGTESPDVSGNSVNDGLMSYFGRVQYSYLDKYLFEANGRYDGSSRFARNNRWGFFPSFSLGWRISEESFLQDINWIDELKIRGSWGQIGNQEIGRFQYVPAVSLNYNYPFGGSLSSGAAVSQSKDPDLRWETTTMANIGLDWQMFSGKLFGEVDVFHKRTDGILRSVTLPAQVGDLTGPVTNVAVVDNTGFEIGVNHKNSIGTNFLYEVGVHVTKIKNEVVDLDGETILGHHRITKEGSPIDSWYIYKTDGLFQTQEEVDNYPTITSRVSPGDVKYVDLNEDGKIDGDDRYIAGRTFPEFTYGFNIGASYKGFRLQTMWQGVSNINIYPDHNMAMPFNNGAGITKDWITDSWTPENPNASLPRLTSRTRYATENFSPSDFWLRDASYLRLKNIQLMYSFNNNDFFTKLGIKRLEVFANGQNLLTFSDMKMWDPETNILLSTSSSTLSTLSRYPSLKTVTMGVNINL